MSQRCGFNSCPCQKIIMPQFDLVTFFIQTFWFTVFFFLFYFSYIKFILHPVFKVLNLRKKIYNMSANLNSKIKKTALSNAIYSEILK